MLRSQGVINPDTSGFFHCQTRALDAQLYGINWQYSVYVLLGFFVSEHIFELKQYTTERAQPNLRIPIVCIVC